MEPNTHTTPHATPHTAHTARPFHTPHLFENFQKTKEKEKKKEKRKKSLSLFSLPLHTVQYLLSGGEQLEIKYTIHYNWCAHL